MPLPKSVIHPRMLQHIAPVSDGAMLDMCTIHDPAVGVPVLDDATGAITTPAPVLVYAGRCRVQPLPERGNRSDVIAGREALARRYSVLVPRDAVVATDAVVTVTASSDGDLVGRRLHVADVRVSSLEVERDLLCVEFPLQGSV